jgi:hypothetical protein
MTHTGARGITVLRMDTAMGMATDTIIPGVAGRSGMGRWRKYADICGWVCLLCWLPYLTLFLAAGRLHSPDWMFPAIFWMIYAGPSVGTPLALIAATSRRWWWIVVAVASLAVLSYALWSEAHHPFDL